MRKKNKDKNSGRPIPCRSRGRKKEKGLKNPALYLLTGGGKKRGNNYFKSVLWTKPDVEKKKYETARVRGIGNGSREVGKKDRLKNTRKGRGTFDRKA